jgi:hypothetical protein
MVMLFTPEDLALNYGAYMGCNSNSKMKKKIEANRFSLSQERKESVLVHSSSSRSFFFMISNTKENDSPPFSAQWNHFFLLLLLCSLPGDSQKNEDLRRRMEGERDEEIGLCSSKRRITSAPVHYGTLCRGSTRDRQAKKQKGTD